MSAILNYTTKINPEKTVGEVHAMLGRAGASAVATLYEQGRPCGVTFQMTTGSGPATFQLPVDKEGVARALRAAQKAGRLTGGGMSTPRLLSAEHAERVAWRIVKDWLEAQLALIQAEMARLDTVMLPYLLVDGQTLAERYLERGQRLLEAPS